MPTTPPRIDFYSAGDGRRLAVRVWDAVDAPSARVVVLHGITSHGGWYERCADFLAETGLEVHFLDRRGSGLNADEPGDVNSWQTWIDDVGAYLSTIRKTGRTTSLDDHPHVVLCGISWGGKLAAAVGRRHAALVDAIALICPGIYSPFQPRLAKRLALAAPAPIRLQQRRVRIPLRRAELFTDTPSWRDFIANDPLTLRRVTWRFAREDQRLTRCARAAAPFLHMPTLLMLAGKDRIVDNGRTRKFFGRMAGRKKTLIEYPGASHTLEFECDPLPYFNDLADWIDLAVAARDASSNA